MPSSRGHSKGMVVLVLVSSVAAAVVLPVLWRWLKPRPVVASKTVFITGGSEGIGKAMALEFVKRGANVVVMARTEAKLKNAVHEMELVRVSPEQKLGMQTMDVSSCSNVQQGFQAAIADFGTPSFLIASVGGSTPGYFLEQDASVFERTMHLNYMGTVHAVKAVAPVMKAHGGGHIMIIASAAGVCSFIGYSSYSPSKFALRGLADALRSELSGFGIHVSICYPPDTDTPGFKEEEKLKPPETRACFPADAFGAESVAAKSVYSLLAGDYHIQSVDFLQNLLVSSMSGVTPRSFTVLEILLSPLIMLIEQPFWMWFDFQAGKYARRVRQEEQASGPKKQQ